MLAGRDGGTMDVRRCMRTILGLFTLLVLIHNGVAQTTATPPPAVAPDVVRISVHAVQMDVTVSNAAGEPVTGLTADDFKVFEDGLPRTVTNCVYVPLEAGRRLGPAGKTPPSGTAASSACIRPDNPVILAVDDIGMSFQSVAQVRYDLTRYVQDSMVPGRCVALVTTGRSLDLGAVQPFTTDPEKLLEAISRIRYLPHQRSDLLRLAMKGTSPAKMLTTPLKVYFPSHQEEQAVVSALDNLRYLVNRLSKWPGLKTMILFSDGLPLHHALADMQRVYTLRNYARARAALLRLESAANLAAVRIYTVDARGLKADGSYSFYRTLEGLSTLATQTGGFSIYNRNKMEDCVRTVLQSQRGYYIVAFQPAEANGQASGNRYHKITVQVNRPDLQVRYRTVYGGVIPADIRRGPSPRPHSLLADLAAPLSTGGIGLDVTSRCRWNPRDQAEIVSRVHISGKRLGRSTGDGGLVQSRLEVLTVTQSGAGDPIHEFHDSYNLELSPDEAEQVRQDGLNLVCTTPVHDPGEYQVRVAVRDLQSGTVDTAMGFVTVPSLADRNLVLANFELLTETTAPAVDRSPATVVSRGNSGLPLESGWGEPVIRGSGGSLAYRFQVRGKDAATFGPTRPLQGRWRIYHDGRLLAEEPLVLKGAAADAYGIVAVRGRIDPGSDWPPGRYRLQVQLWLAAKGEKESAVTATRHFRLR